MSTLVLFERNLIRKRTKAGLETARTRSRLGGRKKALNKKERKKVVQMYERKNHTIKEICQMMNISKPTLYAYVRENQNTKKAKA